MSHHRKRHGPAPVPSENQPQAGPPATTKAAGHAHAGGGAPFQDQDTKRRLGDFDGAGEHALQEPSASNDGQQHSR